MTKTEMNNFQIYCKLTKIAEGAPYLNSYNFFKSFELLESGRIMAAVMNEVILIYPDVKILIGYVSSDIVNTPDEVYFPEEELCNIQIEKIEGVDFSTFKYCIVQAQTNKIMNLMKSTDFTDVLDSIWEIDKKKFCIKFK